jgi:hypothetical protein
VTELVSLEEPTESESRPHTSRLKILLAVLGVSVLVASLTLGPTVLRMLSQRSASLTAPPAVGTYTLDSSEAATAASTDLTTTLRAQIEVDNAVGAVYTDPAAGVSKSVIIAAGSVFLFNPERELDTVIGFGGNTEEVAQMTKVEPGPLAGVMKCGTGGKGEDALTVCGWADHGSIAIALFPGHSTEEAAALMRDFRGAMEKR